WPMPSSAKPARCSPNTKSVQGVRRAASILGWSRSLTEAEGLATPSPGVAGYFAGEVWGSGQGLGQVTHGQVTHGQVTHQTTADPGSRRQPALRNQPAAPAVGCVHATANPC